ncbi:MAG: hypothetical protein IJE60_07325 [Tyzzerella sp.]|nr:hypothetical protein [Tyzzerella sp.]
MRNNTKKRVIKTIVTVAAIVPLLVGCSGMSWLRSEKETSILKELSKSESSNSYVDFSQRSGVPLFKKYSYFVIGDTDFGLVNKYASELEKLRSRATRFSLTVQGKSHEALSVKKHMKSAMSLFGNSIDKYSTCFWHMSYAVPAIKPALASLDSEDKYYFEPSYEEWNSSWSSAAAFMRENDVRSYWEVWNEPDQPFWTKFDWDGYIRMYQNTAQAVRIGDADALVGGISASHLSVLGVDKYRQFLDAIKASNTPIDFVSFHDYDKGYLEEIPQIEAELTARKDYYSKTQIMYTEFNIHNVAMNEWSVDASERTDFTLQKSAVVPEMIEAIENMNDFTDVSVVQWAALTQGNSAFAIIDNEGHRAPAYWAHYLYAHMPVERVLASNTDENIQVMASSDEGKSAVMICNSGDEDVTYSLDLKNIPYKKYDATIYRIDKNHASYLESEDGSDELKPISEKNNLKESDMQWSGNIPAGGTVYIEFVSGEACPLEEKSDVGYIVRNDHYYKDRTVKSYSDFDDLTATAFVGTGDSDQGRGCTAVTLRDVNDIIKVTGKQSGELKSIDANSYVGVRVDYHTANGYSYAVQYVEDDQSLSRTSEIPFGTSKSADKTETVNLEDFEINVVKNAPEDWDGQIVITFDIENTGKNTEYKWTMK